MENYWLNDDVKLLCITANSFPEGVMDAFQTLHIKVPDAVRRTAYGISFSDGKGGILYKAATTANDPEETARAGCESFLLRKGRYATEIIPNWKENMHRFGEVFRQLLQQPEMDPQGYCAEWYQHDDSVVCMVKLADANP